jgi:hypothetical protein
VPSKKKHIDYHCQDNQEAEAGKALGWGAAGTRPLSSFTALRAKVNHAVPPVRWLSFHFCFDPAVVGCRPCGAALLAAIVHPTVASGTPLCARCPIAHQSLPVVRRTAQCQSVYTHGSCHVGWTRLGALPFWARTPVQCDPGR